MLCQKSTRARPSSRQIGQKLLQLLRRGLVLEHARRLVSLIRHSDVGLINSDKNIISFLGGFCKPSRAACCLAFPEAASSFPIPMPQRSS
jgi:hypothetical protein